MRLGERLKKARVSKNMTQESAAKKLDITFQALSNYERGVRDPDTDLLRRMADLYDVSTDYLLGRTNHSNYPHTQAAHKEEDIPLTESDLDYIERLLKDARERFKKNKGL